MPDLNFEVVGAEAPPFAALPTLIFKLRVDNLHEEERIQSVALQSQIRLAVTRRRYNPDEQARLLELFGEPERWGDTLRSMLWTHASTTVTRFSSSTIADLPVACTYDFEVVSTKYFDALEDGDIPLNFLFSGTIFYENEQGHLRIGQISWSKEANYRLPVALWKEMIARYYPNTAWIRLQKDVFDQLYHYKATHAIPTWDQVISRLLRESGGEEVGS
ncbi:MAG TPA: DUF6084 family protein [Ktedonobacteraceae bacterium]|nr:DUF6084 family protein [Ktedonobacteraceae bacterium]